MPDQSLSDRSLSDRSLCDRSLPDQSLPDFRTADYSEPGRSRRRTGNAGKSRRYLPSPEVLDELAALGPDLATLAADLHSCLTEAEARRQA